MKSMALQKGQKTKLGPSVQLHLGGSTLNQIIALQATNSPSSLILEAAHSKTLHKTY